MELYSGDTHIGDYERSIESEIPRKLREIVRSTDFLQGTYANFGKFAVRWNGRERVKAVRNYQEGFADPGRGAQPLAVISREYWAGEGVRRQALANPDVPDTGNVEPEIVDISDQRIQIMPKAKVHTIPQGSVVAAYFLEDGTEVFKAY